MAANWVSCSGKSTLRYRHRPHCPKRAVAAAQRRSSISFFDRTRLSGFSRAKNSSAHRRRLAAVSGGRSAVSP